MDPHHAEQKYHPAKSRPAVSGETAPQARQIDAVSAVKSYIRAHLPEDLTRDSLAAMVYLNPDYLSHLFKRETGVSLTGYIIETRIGEACRLLTEKDGNIREIAVACGFRNISYFTRQFKKHTGLTPRAFRQQAAGNSSVQTHNRVGGGD